jgi:hypothetical protein
VILFIIGFLFFLFLTIITFVKYIFNEEKIIISIPLFKENVCFIDDIIGYTLLRSSGNDVFTIYTKNKSASIRVEGKKIRQEVYNFINNTYEKIKSKNMEELKNDGTIVKINKNRILHFFIDYLEIIKNGIEEKHFYKNLIVKCLELNIIKLVSKENVKINFTIYQCKGNIGLFDYLLNYKWEYKKL